MTFFSIITPLFNKETYIEETIASVQSQTYIDWEMLIIDNNSQDNSYAIAKKASIGDSRIQLLQFLEKQGPGATRNFGLHHSVGQWVLFLDADDLIEENFLEVRYKLISTANSNFQIIAGGWKEFDDFGKSSAIIKNPSFWLEEKIDITRTAIAYAPWALHAAIVSHNWLSAERQWPENLDDVSSEDTAFWFRVLHEATVKWCDDSGALYRVNTINSRNQISNPIHWITSVTKVIESNLYFLEEKKIQPSPEQCESLFRLFESLYQLTLINNLPDHIQQQLENKIYMFMSLSKPSLGIYLRMLLGVKKFNFLRFKKYI